MKKLAGCMLVVLSITIWLGHGAALRGYRNLNGLCAATGRQTSDREFIISALMQTKYKTWASISGSQAYEDLLRTYPDCCTVRRGYNERRLIKEGVIWEGGFAPHWSDRLIGSGYARITIDPRKIPIKDPYWNKRINPAYIYTNTCANGVDEGGNRRMYEG